VISPIRDCISTPRIGVAIVVLKWAVKSIFDGSLLEALPFRPNYEKEKGCRKR
jgi:hypothetical protein